MAEYIEREAICKACKNSGSECTGKDCEIPYIPAADVAPVRHGRWVFDHMTGERAYYADCSECGNRKHFVDQEAVQKEKYCPNCGAKMEG